MATTTRKRRSTDTRNDHPHADEGMISSKWLCGPTQTEQGRTHDTNKAHQLRTTTPNEATTRADAPIWHQLLRHTVEFSKNRRASPTHPCGLLAGGSFSNLAELVGPSDRMFPRPDIPTLSDIPSRTSRLFLPGPARRCRRRGVVMSCWGSSSRGTSHRGEPSVSVPPCRATQRTLRGRFGRRQASRPGGADDGAHRADLQVRRRSAGVVPWFCDGRRCDARHVPFRLPSPARSRNRSAGRGRARRPGPRALPGPRAGPEPGSLRPTRPRGARPRGSACRGAGRASARAAGPRPRPRRRRR